MQKLSVVLVTGGLGFIGSHVVDLLVSEDFSVVVVDNGYSGVSDNISHHIDSGSVEFFDVDIRDYDALSKVFEGVDSVIHLAAVVSVDEFLDNPFLGFDVNVIGTLNVAEAARRFDVDKIVFASSTAVYGEPTYLPIDESHPTNPRNPYGASKLAGEKILFSYSDTYGLKVVALRYFNVYGPRMRPGPYAGVIYRFISSVLKREPIRIFGDGEQTRDFVYVKDVARATVRALNYNFSDVFNVGTGVSTSINELAELVMKLTGTQVDVIHENERPGDIKRSMARIDKISRDLNWRPEFSLTEGLRETIRYLSSRIT